MYAAVPRPAPNSHRPLLRTSSVATRSATRNGLWQGIRITAKPSRMLRVRCESAARNISGLAEWPISAKKCCSVSQKYEKPAASAATTWSRFCQ